MPIRTHTKAPAGSPVTLNDVEPGLVVPAGVKVVFGVGGIGAAPGDIPTKYSTGNEAAPSVAGSVNTTSTELGRDAVPTRRKAYLHLA